MNKGNKRKATRRFGAAPLLGGCKYTITLIDDGVNSDCCAAFLASLGVRNVSANNRKQLAPCKLTIRKHDVTHPRGIIVENMLYFGRFHSGKSA